jgi:hypothetical protein
VSKYGARKTSCQAGHTHASKREATRCNELHLLLRAGEIEDLEQQPQFYFVINGRQVKLDGGRRAGVKLDFAYVDRLSGSRIVEDSKGYTVRDWPLRKAIFRALFPDLVLREV